MTDNNLNVNLGVTGRFKFETFKGYSDDDGNIVEIPGTREQKADWSDNIFTDQGMNRLGTSDTITNTSYCHVGSGSSTPSATDTSLDTLIATTDTSQSSNSTSQDSTTPYYVSYSITKRFGEGVAAGNLSEVGMGYGSSVGTLCSRALILDNTGSPTTITVLSDEYLDVTYEFRVYPPAIDSTGTITLNGVVYDYTRRAANISSANPGGWYPGYGFNNLSPAFSRVYEGGIETVFSSPSGTSDAAGSATLTSYSNNSYDRTATLTWGLNDGNLSAGVRSVKITHGPTSFQYEFSAQTDGSPIPKNNQQILSFDQTISWSRASI